jgi:hypothetical protein
MDVPETDRSVVLASSTAFAMSQSTGWIEEGSYLYFGYAEMPPL